MASQYVTAVEASSEREQTVPAPEVNNVDIVEEDNSEKLIDKAKNLEKLQGKYSHVIIQLIEDDGKVELFQIRSGWLFLERETENIWCWYPNCKGSGKYLVRCPLPDLNDAAANFTRYKCLRWPRQEDCFHGKTEYFSRVSYKQSNSSSGNPPSSSCNSL
jgi:hypothetical protein